MPNLKGIGLQNFRTFKDYEYLEFAPITLITGANNSGKSSIFKAIMLLKSVYEDKYLRYNINNKYKHTMSSVSRIVNNSSEENSLSFTLPLEILRFRNLNVRGELHFEYNKRANNYSLNRISIKRNILKNNLKTEQLLYSVNLTNDDEFIQVLHVSVDKINIKEILNLIEYKAVENNDYTNNIESSEDDLSFILENSSSDEDFFGWENGIYKDSFKEKVEKKHKFNLSNENWINDDIEIGDRSRLYHNIDFNKIEEIIRHSKTHISADYFFEDTSFEDYDKFTNLNIRELELLITYKEKNKYILQVFNAFYHQVNTSVRKNLKTIGKIIHLPVLRGRLRSWYVDEQKDELVDIFISYFNNKKYQSSEITTFISQWIGEGGFNIGKEIEIQRSNEIGFTRIFIVLDKKINEKALKIPLTDLGYGASQLLPIILSIANIASSSQVERMAVFDSRTILIEEPEANLHPNLQAKLAEFFIDATSRFNIQFILETHSEYLIYKFQEYIGKQIIKPSDVALYYLNHPDSDKKYVNRVPIKEDGSIEYEKYFGTGFFDEQTNLKLSLLNIQRDNFLDLFQKTKEKFATNDALTEEEQLKKLNGLIDYHFDKLDFSTHIGFVKTQFPNHGKLLTKSVNYLASGYHLFTIIDDNNQIMDYSPAVLQFGRAVENEIHELFKQVKDDILVNPDYIDWLSDFNSQEHHLTIGDTNFKRQFKNYIRIDVANANEKKYKISFGNMRQVFDLLNQEPIANIQNVDLLNALYDFLKNQYFNNWLNVKTLIPTLANIVDLRNESAHTYANPISRLDAFNYKVEVENWLRVWSDENSNDETNNNI
jgi:predicted ATPase